VKYKTDAVKSKGTYTFGSGWNLSGTTDYMSHAGDELVATGGGVTLTESSQQVNDADKYLMLLPQEVADGAVTIEVKWTVGVTQHNRSLNLPHQVWLPGKRYDYNLTVSMTGITLDPVLVDPWGDDDLYKPCTITYKTPDGTDIVEYRTMGVTYPVGDYVSSYPDCIWTTEANGTGRTYRANDNIFCTGNLTLFAQWTGRTNCYMVKPGETVRFRVSRAYQDDGASTTLRNGMGDHTGEFTIEEVWDPDNLVTAAEVNGSGPDAVITVTAAGGSGNALVAIKAGSDIAWSYHIWVTDYEGNNTVTMYNGHVFMDRNLGATANDLSTAAYGLFYQWGRKDPFLRGNPFTSTATSAEKGTITYTIKHPDTFLTADDASQIDWHYDSRNNYLWKEQTTGNKTIYDPCPAGWRVPAYKGAPDRYTSPWYEYQDTTYLATGGSQWMGTGYLFIHQDNTRAYYPAAGYRTEYGGYYAGGSTGNYWSTDTNIDTQCYVMTFANWTVYSDYRYRRANGITVRCVREITGPAPTVT
jgi:uncharacterized protein (TIGR02145 family)